MSVVAWDGKTLAADCQGNFDDVPVPGSKVFAHDGVLYGTCGSIEDKIIFQEWILGGSTGVPPEMDHIQILKVEDGAVTFLTQRLISVPIQMPFWAIGAGCDFALGAMAAGATAERAVKIACGLCTSCGLGVETLKAPRRKRNG